MSAPDIFDGGYNRELCTERHTDLRERLNKTDDRLDSLEKCTIKLTQMIEKYDSRLDSHSKRISAIENKPLRLIEKIIGYAVSALFGALAAGAVTGFINTI